MLLLERDASTDNGWWAMVFRTGGYGAATKRALLDPTEPVRIRPLVQVEDRLALLQAMLDSTPGISVPLNDTAFRTKLMRLDWGGDPLSLMMAAMAMGQVGHAQALVLGRTDLAESLAEREAERFANLAKAHGLGAELLTHLAACVTLTQGMSRDELERFAVAEKEAIHRPSGGDVAALADVMQEALPRGDGIAPVLPDLIGEALILRTLRGVSGAQAVLRCLGNFGAPVAASVIRCAQDFAPRVPAPLRWLEVIAAVVSDDEAAIAALAASLPMRSLVLRDLNLTVAQRLQQLLAGREGISVNELAAATRDLATAEGLAGKAEDARRHGQQAVDSYRALAVQHPDVFRADLASSLSNLSTWLSNLGQRKPALQAAQEAVDLYRELAPQRPEAFWSELAGTLNNLASMQRDLGQRESALHSVQEAADLHRKLAAQHPDVFQHDLAMSLTNLAITLGELYQHEPALNAAQEAVDLDRELAAQRPDVFLPHLATALNNLASALISLNQYERGLGAAQEAVSLRRELTARRPEVFQSDLATSLNNLANILSALERHEAALHAGQEAVDLYRELVTQGSDVFLSALATTLNNLSGMLKSLGQHEAALQAAQESVDLRRELAAQHPDAFRTDLATSLIVLALRTKEVSGAESAVAFAQEAVATLLPDFQRRPNVYSRLMATMMRDYLLLCESANQKPAPNLVDALLPYFTDKE
jgi:hypothetical protein